MMKIKMNKIMTVLLAVLICLYDFAPLADVRADSNTIKIQNTKDYEELVKKCKTDTWSQNKTVELTANLDFSKIKFTPIPTFGGNFNGNGYTITGLNLTSKGSYQGVFRYVQKGAVVENLNVSGKIAPEGTKKNIGGIVGENSGSIKNCSFSGDVSAKVSVGGICGYNTESGRIEQSSFKGSVTGESYTGGIAGQNFGLITGCENRGAINTVNVEKDNALQDLDISLETIGTTESISANTDTGGICGYTKGKIISCRNYGNVGYKSVGYNTGGISGRTAGYISGCENYGIINGRKDIGGICGQAEPYVLLEYSEDVLEQLRDSLDRVRNIINNSANSDNALEDNLDNINSAVSDASDSLFLLSDNILDYADDLTGSINDMADRLHKAMTDSESVFNSMSEGTSKMADGLAGFEESAGYLQDAIEEIKKAVDEADNESGNASDSLEYLTESLNQLSAAMGEIKDCVASIEGADKKLKNALHSLTLALAEKKNIEKNFQALWDSLQSVADSLIKAGGSIEEVAKILEELKNNGYFKEISSATIDNLKKLANNYKTIARALGEVRDAIMLMAEDFDMNSAKNAFKMLEKSFDNLADALDSLDGTSERLRDILDHLEIASDSGSAAVDSMKNALSKIKDGTSSIGNGIDSLNGIVKDATAGGAFNAPSASEAMSGNIESLKTAVRSLTDQFSSMNDIIKDKKKKLSDDIKSACGEMETLSDVLNDAYQDALNADKDNIYEDISDIDHSGDARGKVENSQNCGQVNGDVNVGGISGSMAIEYDFDPEDDAQKKGDKSIKFTYKTKCIIRRCTNNGEVISKKDYSGGICGRMDLGSLMSSENYGKVTASDGNYVGGIAGKSDTVIRNCAVKSEVSGGDYVGGIAGESAKLYDCMSLVYVSDFGEFAGAIAGKADMEKLRNNRFVGDDIGGIDDINYTGLAEQEDVGGFVNFVESNFGKDVTFTLTFVADDKEIAKVNFNYKDSIPEDSIPKVPEKKGYYGKWSDYDFGEATYDAKITAEYHRNMDIISSEASRDGGKAVILACGAFDDNSKINARKNKEDIGKKVIDSYGVNLDGCYSKNYKIRYLPLSEKKYDIYVDEGNGAKKVSTKKYGSYVEFETSASEFTVYEMKKGYTSVIISVILIILIAAAIFIMMKRGMFKHISQKIRKNTLTKE